MELEELQVDEDMELPFGPRRSVNGKQISESFLNRLGSSG